MNKIIKNKVVEAFYIVNDLCKCHSYRMVFNIFYHNTALFYLFADN